MDYGFYLFYLLIISHKRNQIYERFKKYITLNSFVHIYFFYYIIFIVIASIYNLLSWVFNSD